MTLPLANIFQPLIDVFETVMLFFHDNFGVGWGVSIILLTVVVRAALIPLTLKQFRSMQALQRLQPEIKKLQARYKDDKQRLNQEMMKFYQENKVNPLGSCLPLAAQMPVFLSLFYMLRKDLKEDICGRGQLAGAFHQAVQAAPHHDVGNVACDKVAHGSAQFLFIPDLTHAATGGVLIFLLVLYVGSQLGSSLLMMSQTPTTDKNQQRIMLFLPLLFVVFIRTFPAGLIVYWITTNLWTVVQQFIVRRQVGHIHPQPAAAPAGAAALTGGDDAKPGGGGRSLSVLRRRGAEPEEGKAATGKEATGKEATATKKASPAKPPRSTPPPSSPRKKKKRSGRRR